MKFGEAPSRSAAASTIVFIGRNGRGNWVAREQNGLFGGLFVDRAQAVKYALFENGQHPETIVELPRAIELNAGGSLVQNARTGITVTVHLISLGITVTVHLISLPIYGDSALN